MRVVDGSYANLTVEAARALRASGVEAWVQCLWTGSEQPPPRVSNLRNALAGGLLVAGYISVTGEHDGAWHAAHGWGGVPADLWAQLHLVFVDVELPGIPTATVRQAVEALAALGKRRAIYTSYHAWADLMGNAPGFTDCLLWDANWDGMAALQLVRPYGGWTVAQLVGKQYSGGTQVGGVFVDLDEFNQSLFEEDNVADDPTAKRTALLVRWAGLLMTGDDANIRTVQAELNYLLPPKSAPVASAPDGKNAQ